MSVKRNLLIRDFKKYIVLICFLILISISSMCLLLFIISADHRNESLVVVCFSTASFSMLMLIPAVFRLCSRLFIPVKQLFKGMTEVGATSMDVRIREENHNPLLCEMKGVYDRLDSIIHLIENLNRNVPFKDILDHVYKSFSDYIPYTYIGVALIDEDGKNIKASFGVGGTVHLRLPDRMLGYSTSIESTSLGTILESGKERIINNLEEHLKGKPLKEYNRILFEEGIRSSITFPLKSNSKPVGIIFFSSKQKNIYRSEHVEFLKTLANSIALGLEKSILMDNMVISSVQALARLAEQRDPETGEHLYRMSTYSRVIAEILSRHEKYKGVIGFDYINSIERFSPLHDIGKVGIRDEILMKPGKLTGEEFAIMKTHTIYGAWVLKSSEENMQKSGRSIFKTAIEIAEGHHEKWDGSGYPYGRSGTEIPLSARIVAVADVFDALTSKRPYKEPFTYDDSCRIIIEGAGKHFDPDIVDAFIKSNEKIKSIYNDFRAKGILSINEDEN